MQEKHRRRRWPSIFKPDARAEVADELAFHLEQRVQDNIALGMNPDDARAAAMERLGNLESVQDECAALLRAERPRPRRGRKGHPAQISACRKRLSRE